LIHVGNGVLVSLARGCDCTQIRELFVYVDVICKQCSESTVNLPTEVNLWDDRCGQNEIMWRFNCDDVPQQIRLMLIYMKRILVATATRRKLIRTVNYKELMERFGLFASFSIFRTSYSITGSHVYGW
jgi:hypothetical protein